MTGSEVGRQHQCTRFHAVFEYLPAGASGLVRLQTIGAVPVGFINLNRVVANITGEQGLLTTGSEIKGDAAGCMARSAYWQ